MVLYHHSIDLENVVYGELRPDPTKSERDLLSAYRWLEEQVGFYPLFLAVGKTDEDIRMTGYYHQWARITGTKFVQMPDGTSVVRNKIRKKGEFPNRVLFSFNDLEGRFTDYENWHIILNSIDHFTETMYEITDYKRRLVLKPSWPTSRWIRKARNDPCSVQLVVPSLNFPEATRIWVRNKATKRKLEDMEFKNVEVHRMLVERDW